MPPSLASVIYALPYRSSSMAEGALRAAPGITRGGIAGVCNGKVPLWQATCGDSGLGRQIVASARTRTRAGSPSGFSWVPPSRVGVLPQPQAQEWALFVADTRHARLGQRSGTQAAMVGVVREHNISVRAFLEFRKTLAAKAGAGVGGHAGGMAEPGGATIESAAPRVAALHPVSRPAAPASPTRVWPVHLDTPEKRQAHVQRLRDIYRGLAKPTLLEAAVSDAVSTHTAIHPAQVDAALAAQDRNDPPVRQASIAAKPQAITRDAIPDAWFDDGEECIFLQGQGASETTYDGLVSDWAPQTLFAASGSSVQPDPRSDGPECMDAHAEGRICGISDTCSRNQDRDDDEVPERVRSLEETMALWNARRRKVEFANTKLSLQADVGVKRTRTLGFHQYEVCSIYDTSAPPVNAGHSALFEHVVGWQHNAAVPAPECRVLYTKLGDGKRSDLPPAAVQEVSFLRPEIAYEVRNGRTVRAAHFRLSPKLPHLSRAGGDSAGEHSAGSSLESDGDDVLHDVPHYGPASGPYAQRRYTGDTAVQAIFAERDGNSSEDESLY